MNMLLYRGLKLILLVASVQGFAPTATQMAQTRPLGSQSLQRLFVSSIDEVTSTSASSDNAEELSGFESISVEVAQKQNGLKDINEVVNKAALAGLGLLIFLKIAMIDADVSRGWTVQETVTRVPADIWKSYMDVLTNNPVATKAFTSASVYTIGDFIAQRTEGKSIGEIDRARVARSMIAGGIGHGPMSHFWYIYCDNFFENVIHLTQWWSFIPKVIVDQSVWGPIWNNSYLLLLGLMKMESPGKIFGDMKRTTIPLILSGLKLWPAAHLITYGLIPNENRLLWVDMVEIVWVTILATKAASLTEEAPKQQESKEPLVPSTK